MDAQRKDLLRSIGLLILRVGPSVYLMTHGWGKVQMVLEGAFDQFGDPLGLGTGPSLVLAAGAEFACAILVAIGLATRFAAIPIVITMLVAAFMVHGSDPWTMGEGASKEPALLYMFPFLALIFTGPGCFSLDALISCKCRRKSAA